MHYEVFIPSAEPEGFDVTLTVEANNWMSALKSGLERLGEGTDIVRNVMCDIKSDNTIHVTDATSRRVFILREIEAPAESATQDEVSDTLRTPAVEQPEPAPTAVAIEPEPAPVAIEPEPEPEPAPSPAPVAVAPEPAKTPQAAPVVAVVEEPEADEKKMRIGSATFEALQRDEPKAKVLSEKRQKTDERAAAAVPRVEEKVSETLIEDVFLEIQDIHEGNMDMEEVVNFVMDMAVDKVQAESGAILFADVNGRELYFATARGPKADEVMDFRVPMGQGIVGFCAREGVSLAINDAQKDPRFYKKVSESLGYQTTSLLCAAIQHDGRVYGAIELINKNSGSAFSSNEMNVLAYIGRQLGQYVYDVIMGREKLD